MPRRRSREGTCHICGNIGPLSFEHVPPRKAFNDKLLIRINFDRIITLGPDEKITGPQIQGGAGDYTLCPRCNNNTGSWYAKDFIDWCYHGLDILIKSNGRPTLIHLFHLFPLRILKQIVTMFFSINGDQFRNSCPDLVKFVLDKEERHLPSRYRFFVYYNIEGMMRSTGIQSSIDVRTMNTTFMSEINYPPYGYVMTLNSGPPDPRLVEITFFSESRYEDFRSMAIRLPVLPTHMWFPGDYRDKDEIRKQAQMAENYQDND